MGGDSILVLILKGGEDIKGKEKEEEEEEEEGWKAGTPPLIFLVLPASVRVY